VKITAAGGTQKVQTLECLDNFVNVCSIGFQQKWCFCASTFAQ